MECIEGRFGDISGRPLTLIQGGSLVGADGNRDTNGERVSVREKSKNKSARVFKESPDC